MRLFWHVYAVNHWYEIAGEALACLAESAYPEPVEAHVVGGPGQAHDLAELAGWHGVRLDVTVHAANQYEYPTLAALWRWCQSHDTPAGYIHTKGVTRPNCPPYAWWRWMMLAEIVLRWPDRLRDLESHDAVGCTYRPDWPCFAGNFWWARADWIRARPEPRPSRDRYDHERWLLAGGQPRVKALISVGGEPCQPEYYRIHGTPQWFRRRL